MAEQSKEELEMQLWQTKECVIAEEGQLRHGATAATTANTSEGVSTKARVVCSSLALVGTVSGLTAKPQDHPDSGQQQQDQGECQQYSSIDGTSETLNQIND